jgi:serine/threonine protein phosphatase PrpC
MAETPPLSPPPTVAAASDRGRSRTRNEDAHLVDASAGLIVVGDGMGGHPAGDVASATAVEEVGRHLRDPSSGEALGGRMLQAVLRADARVRDVGSADPARHGMGTTVTALIAPAGTGRVVIGHVGDSRAYVFERGTIRQLTRDHTWIEQQIATGALTRDEAHGHRWSHVLTQAAGAGDEIDPDVLELNATPGQVYLLCTDGLTNMLTDLAIERTLEDTLSMGLEATAWALVDGANDRGGIDNITVALLRI